MKNNSEKSNITLTFYDIVWAATTFGTYYDNLYYLNVLKQEKFIEALRFHPSEMDIADVSNILVDFLNKWGCRLKNYDYSTASNLKECIVKAHSDLLSLQHNSIFDFENELNKDKVEGIFNAFWFYGSNVAKNFGPTATSKTLHIINPKLFTMWDDKIRLHYWVNNNEIIDSGRGYYLFLLEIKKIADCLVSESKKKCKINNPALWLSKRLKISPSMSIVKFIDEYNWLTYTKSLQKPDDWIPPFLIAPT